MDSNNVVCPVCTLFLRPGITLKQHLTSHPKQKVIEALVKLAGVDELSKPQNSTPSIFPPNLSSPGTSANTTIANQAWNPTPVQLNPSGPIGNHVFIYQQSVSTSAPPQGNVLNVNPLSQQYVYHPAIFSPQMMPYVYQQQQVILASNSLHSQIKALPFGASESDETTNEKENCIEVEKTNSNDVFITDTEGDDAVDDSVTKKELEVISYEENIKTMEDFENEQNEINEIPPDNYNIDENEEQVNCSPYSDHSEHSDNSEWKTESECSKACQTQTADNVSLNESPEKEVESNMESDQFVNVDHPDYYYVDHRNDFHESGTVTKETNYEQSEPIYTSANILHGNDHLDFMNLDDIVIMSEFNSNPVASQVEHFENTLHDRPGVLMTIGEINDNQNNHETPRDYDESMSRSSSHLNIRSDERMPARGELSGQESIGGNSDISNWNRIQYQENGAYEIIGYEASDSESLDHIKRQTSTQVSSRDNYDDDVPTITGFSGPPLNFKCATCGEGFSNSKERKEHELEKHPGKTKNIIGSEIGKKNVKKLVIKAKSDKTKTEPTFDNVFTNKLKIENQNEVPTPTNLVTLDTSVKTDETLELPDIKTICTICDCVFENQKSLKQHRIEVHKEVNLIKHKCLTCGEVFPNEYKYTDHLKIHPLECRLCGKLFFRKQNIRLHMKRHLGLKPYKCEICEKSFVTRQKHDEHKNIHTGDAPIKCNFCDEKFRRHSNLVQHRNRHHFQVKKKIKDYICQCGEIFHTKKKLAWHKETHDSKPKACSHCSEKFIHMSSLTRHMRRAHNDKFLPDSGRDNENVECPICKGIYLKSSLDVHIKNHSGSRPYTCLMCNKDFTTKWNLKLHKWTHASRTSKPFKCELCKGAFIRESDYTAHMNSHKSVRPYTCNYCGAQFIRKYNCLRHVKEHENDKTFSCNVCGKTFHRSYYLKDHMRVHSGVRPYTCNICGKTSTTKSNHNKHVQIHHAREPVSTEN